MLREGTQGPRPAKRISAPACAQLLGPAQQNVCYFLGKAPNAKLLSGFIPTIFPRKSLAEGWALNKPEKAVFCASMSLAGTRRSMIPECFNPVKCPAKKSVSRVMRILSSLSASLNTSPFLMDLGQPMASCPKPLRKGRSPACTFSSKRNFMLCTSSAVRLFSEPCREIQYCINVPSGERRIGGKDFLCCCTSLKHFQHQINHDPCSPECGLSVADFAVSDNELVDFYPHNKNIGSSRYLSILEGVVANAA